MPIDFERTDHEGTSTLRLTGQLLGDAAGALTPTIDAMVEARPRRAVIDLGGVDEIDSAGVAALIRLYKGVHNQGGEVRLVGARDQPLAFMRLLRMDAVFDL